MSFEITQLKELFQQNGYVVVLNFSDSNELRTGNKKIKQLIQIPRQKNNQERAFHANKQNKSSLKQLRRIEEADFFKAYSTSSK